MSQCPPEAAFLCSSNQTCSSWSSWLIWLSCWSKLIRLAWLTWLAGVLWLAEACHLLPLRTTREDDVESCQLFLFPWLYLWSFALASCQIQLVLFQLRTRVTQIANTCSWLRKEALCELCLLSKWYQVDADWCHQLSWGLVWHKWEETLTSLEVGPQSRGTKEGATCGCLHEN